MRQRWLASLALSLGVLVMGRGALFGADTPAPVIQPYPPVEVPAPRSQADVETTPAASLDRPIPLRDERPAVDPKIQPTGLFSNRGGDGFAFGSPGSFPAAQPLPAGPGNNTTLPMPAPVLTAPTPPDVPYTWRQPPVSSYPAANAAGSPGPLVPIPNASAGTSFGIDPPTPQGSVVSPGGVAAPGVAAGPMGGALVDGGFVGDDCCTPGCCNGCGLWNCCGNGCCFGNRWYGSAEYLLWFIRGDSLPPLLTTGPINSALPGALGMPGTSVLYGGNTVANNPFSGVRLRGGYWFNDCHGLGLDLGGFFLGGGTNSFTASSLGVPFLARPFVTAVPFNGVPIGGQSIEAVATPNGLAGTFTALNTFFLYGAEANLRRNICCGCNWFIDAFAGWRLLGLNESLSMNENLAIIRSANPTLPAGSTFQVHDRFGTSNLFNGGQIGVIGEYRFGRWSIDVRNGVALGGTQQFANISGSTTSAGPGIFPSTSPGGLLALSSNIGPHTRSVVSFVEEVGVNLGYQFTNHIRGFVGYNFLFWSSVIRPGEQIDTVVNPNLVPGGSGGGPNRPAFSFNGSNFWVQGINFGIDIRW